MAVVDLDDVELLDDATVESELLGLELDKRHLTNIDKNESVELLSRRQLKLVPLLLVLNGVYIVGALEHSVHGLLTSSDVIDVSLGLSELLGANFNIGS